MGYEAYAYLIYGFPLPEEFYDRAGDDEEWIAELAGVRAPDVGYTGNEEVYREYWDLKQGAVKEAAIKVVRGSWFEDPHYYLAGHEIWASYGEHKVVDVENLSAVVFEATNRLHEFCELSGVTFEEPRWLLLNSLGV